MDIEWPRKSRELCNHTIDSTRWNGFRFRDGDIVIGTWAKSGTTWMQQIVLQLLHGGACSLASFDLVPWVEQRAFPRKRLYAQLEGLADRRVLKTHLPVDALVFSPQAKYLYMGRDGRDVLWSWYNHHQNLTPLTYEMVNNAPGRHGPPLEPPRCGIREYFLEWLAKDGFPLWPFWSHVQSWWNIRHLPNVLLIHFNELKADMPAQIRRVADFLDIRIDPGTWHEILEHCSFEYMKSNAAALSKTFERAFVGGAQTFIHRGVNGRWREVLSADDVRMYEEAAAHNLTPECASWLAAGP